MLFGNARPRGASRPTLVPVIFAMAALWCAYMSVPVGTAIYLPVVVLVVCAYGACRLVWHDAAAVWNPVTWFLAASAIYYGLGPMIFLSGDTAIGYLRGYYFVDDAALVRTNMLN